MKALEKDRTRRYETANGLARDMQRYLDRRAGGSACPPSARTGCGSLPASTEKCWERELAGLILAIASAVSVCQAVRATKAERAAVDEAAISNAINEFLEKDLLG